MEYGIFAWFLVGDNYRGWVVVRNFCHLGQNICRLFHFLAQFLLTTSETELNYDHQKVNVHVASRVAEQIRTYDLRK